jgi:hypothetical protein
VSGSTKDNTVELEVKIVDIYAKTMKSLILYMYQNNVPEPDVDWLNLLLAANKYNLAELVSHCQESILKNISDNTVSLDIVSLCKESMMSNISDETVLEIAVSSRLLASQEVFEVAKKFIESRPIKSLKAGNTWKKFKKENPKEAKEITQKLTMKK